MTKATAARRTPGASLLAVLALAAVALGGCGDRSSAADHVKAAQARLAAGDVPSAILELKSALQKEPGNPTARIMLGEAYIDIADVAGAEAELQQALDGGVPLNAVAKPLARTELLLHKPRDALSWTEQVDDISPQVAASLQAIRGEALYQLTRKADGDKAFAHGLKLDPQSTDVLGAMARMALINGDLAQAREHIEAALKLAPKDPELLELQGDLAFAENDYVAAEQVFQHLYDMAPWRLSGRLGLAAAQISQGKLTEAARNIDGVLSETSDYPRANYLRALTAYLGNNMLDVQIYTERALAIAPRYASALLISGASNFTLKQYEQATKALDLYLRIEPQNQQAQALLTAINAAKARTPGAIAANAFLEQAADRRAGASSDDDQVAGTAQAKVDDESSSIEALQRTVLQNPESLGPKRTLFRAYLAAKEYRRAVTMAEVLQQREPDNPAGWNFTGIAYLAQNDLPSAKTALLKARELHPGDLEADRNLALIAESQNNFDEARGYLQEAIKANPKDVNTYLDLAALETKVGHADAAEAVLLQAVKNNPESSAPIVVLGRLRIQAGRYADTLSLAQPALAKEPRNPALLQVVGLAQLNLGQTDAAITTFKALIEVTPKAILAHLYLADAYIAAHNSDAALAEARVAQQIEPTNFAPRFAVARLLEQSGAFDAADKAIAELKKDYSNDANVAELEGASALAQKHPEAAALAFQRALQSRSNSADTLLLAQAQSEAGHRDQAEQTLKAWLDQHADDTEAHMALGNLYFSANRMPEAKDQYDAMARLSQNNPVAENNLALALAALGNADQALPHARHAASLAPNSSAILDTLGTILLQTGDAAAAAETLKAASQQAPNDASVQFHLAQALAGSGHKPEARAILQKLLASNQAFSDRPAAEKLMHDLAGG